jgi:glycosyltransferase involved in cell wall biosynthesis
MNHPLVSVVTVTYNQEFYIGQAVEGALQQQTDFGVEIIIGEDCSTDSTREIVLGYQRKYPDRIQVITSNHNVGNRENFLDGSAQAAKAGRFPGGKSRLFLVLP